jgi:hypothetical protein
LELALLTVNIFPLSMFLYMSPVLIIIFPFVAISSPGNR